MADNINDLFTKYGIQRYPNKKPPSENIEPN